MLLKRMSLLISWPSPNHTFPPHTGRSQGGVGSSRFMRMFYKIAKRNHNVIPTNDSGDRDKFKHQAAGYWKHHDRHAIVGTTRDKYGNAASVCFNKVLVVIGDPIHTLQAQSVASMWLI